jgi:hypothetical protein
MESKASRGDYTDSNNMVMAIEDIIVLFKRFIRDNSHKYLLIDLKPIPEK